MKRPRKAPGICARDRAQVEQLLHDWFTGDGRPSHHLSDGFKRMWVEKGLDGDWLEVMRQEKTWVLHG